MHTSTISCSRRAARALAPLLALWAVACSGQDAAPFQHVVLISLDTTRADHLDPYGTTRPTTPRIAALAQSGVVFEQVLSPAPTTLAAHTSIMTGAYPQSHGVARNGFFVNPSNVMLAELLANDGFHTAGFLGSWALSKDFDFDQGFDTLDEEFDVHAMEVPGAGHDQNQRSADKVTDAVLAHVDRVEAERMFLFVHYFDAHQPYEPRAPFGAQFGTPGQMEKAVGKDMFEAVGRHAQRLLGRPLTVSQLINDGMVRRMVEEADGQPIGRDRELANLYAGEVAFMDQQIARLLSGLETRGLLQDALVILTGDHGETFWEHADVWNHGLWVYETTVHVPLIFCFPDGRGAGTRVSMPVSTIDIVPTLCDLLGLNVPQRTEGFSLLPAIDGRPFERGPVFSQATQPLSPLVEKAGGGQWVNRFKPRAARSGRWKYVQAPYLEPGARRGAPLEGKRGLEQLFDLRADPGEQTNLLVRDLAPEAASAYGELKAQLDGWIAAAQPLPSFFNREQNDEVLDRLREMGYAGDKDEDDAGERGAGAQDD